MVSEHNISKQMEEAYRQFQEQASIKVHRNHVEDLTSGKRIPIVSSTFHMLDHFSNHALTLIHPHESGAEVVTQINPSIKGDGEFDVIHGSRIGAPVPNSKPSTDAERYVPLGTYSTLGNLHSGFMEHMSKTEKAIHRMGGVENYIREGTQDHIKKYGGRNLGTTAPGSIGTFDEYGRFTIDKDR